MGITCSWIAWVSRICSERWHDYDQCSFIPSIFCHHRPKTISRHYTHTHTPTQSNLRLNPLLFLVHRIPNSSDPSSIRFSRFLIFRFPFSPGMREKFLLCLISAWFSRDMGFGTWRVHVCVCVVVKACFEFSSSAKRESCSGGTVRGRTRSWTVGSFVARSESSLLVIQVPACVFLLPILFYVF